MPDKEIYSLASEADALAQDVNSRLDNPDYVFDVSAEFLVARLRELAERCRTARLASAARRLDQLARDVQERSGKG